MHSSDKADKEYAKIRAILAETAESQLRAEKKAEEWRLRAEKEAAEWRRRAEKEAAEWRRRTEKEVAALQRHAEESQRRAEKEAAESLIRAEKEAKESLIRAEKEAAESLIRAEKEAVESRIRAEKEAVESRIRAKKEDEEWERRAKKEAAESRRAEKAAEKFSIRAKKEREESQRVSDIRMAKIEKQFGGYIDTESVRLEDEFYDALKVAGEIGDDKLEEIHVRMDVRDGCSHISEYDLVAVNGGKVFVGEIKHKLTAKKVREFAKQFPKYAEHFPAMARGKKIIGMVGGAQINEEVENIAREMGMYVLRLQNRKLEIIAPK